MGTRGAGPKLLLSAATRLAAEDIPFNLVISSKNELINQIITKFGKHTLTIEMNSKISILSIGKFLKYRKALTSLCRKNQETLIIYLMPHPWDIILSPKISTYRVIHDAKKHPGDVIWPTNRALRKRILAGDHLISLSKSVGRQIELLGVSTFQCSHPILDFGERGRVKRDVNTVLFLGRQKKYKGGELLAKSWPIILQDIPAAKLIVAGEGSIHKSFFKMRNVHIENRWLSELEICNLFQLASVAVFPYIEASQSGLMGSAKHFGTKIVSTSVGGLIEQAESFGGLIVRELTATALAEKVVESLTSHQSQDWVQTPQERSDDLFDFLCSLSSRS